MYSRLSSILFPVSLLLLIGAVVWGYQENQEKNSILIKAENQYQRAFHDLNYYMHNLHKELGHALVVSENKKSASFQKKSLVNIWRMTSEAQNQVNQLPLTLLPFNQTEEFLSKIAKFTYQTSLRDLSNEPLSADERKTLRSLYGHSQEIYKDLNKVQTKVISNSLRWMDVETAIATEKQPLDNTIIDGFKTVNKKVSDYPDLNWGPSATDTQSNKKFSALSEPKVSTDEIKRKAAKFLGLNQSTQLRVAQNGKGENFHSYSVTLDQKGEDQLSMDYTKNGGHLIYFMKSRNVTNGKLNSYEAIRFAKQFLEANGFDHLQEINYDQFQNTAHITFAKKQGDVIILPAKMTATVALDNGEVLGVQATEYVTEHQDRNFAKPKISAEEAKSTLDSGFNVEQTNLVVMKDETGAEILCYQLIGKLDQVGYRVYVNAESGEDVFIETVEGAHINL